MINRNNVYFHEWIGSNAQVLESPNSNEMGISGELCNETKNTLLIRSPSGEKSIAKKGRTFALSVQGMVYEIKGSYAQFRPEDRIKERRRISRMIRNGE